MSDRPSDDHGDADDATNPQPAPVSARAVFGDRLEMAEVYHRILATDGIEHGLLGPREVPRLWDRHILNCAVIGEVIDDGESVVDIGSGAGLPGVALAIARPDLDVVLLEPLLRRSAFLERAVAELGLSSVTVVRGRAEEKSIRTAVDQCDVATSRAVAPLQRLCTWSAPLIRSGGRLVAIKGASAGDEIARDRVAAGRVGLTDLRVETVGGEVLPSPTTVVIGTRTESGGRKRGRGKKR